ncbi:MAG: hypothetical protein J3K34DRAFT_430339 [Monoraphidium minutum]|nr:MAG: hypothetical protein J3K34DRAFT_430339 [Monoraphidium minutum]
MRAWSAAALLALVLVAATLQEAVAAGRALRERSPYEQYQKEQERYAKQQSKVFEQAAKNQEKAYKKQEKQVDKYYKNQEKHLEKVGDQIEEYVEDRYGGEVYRTGPFGYTHVRG